MPNMLSIDCWLDGDDVADVGIDENFFPIFEIFGVFVIPNNHKVFLQKKPTSLTGTAL